MPTFLVTASTGRQGSAVVHALLAASQTVHALVRNTSAPAAQALSSAGAKLFTGDFYNLPALTAAAQGCSGVFLNPIPGSMHSEPHDPDTSALDPAAPRPPPGQTDIDLEWQQAENVLSAARATGTVDTVVVSTLFFTGRHPEWEVKDPGYLLASYYASKWRVEQAVKNAGFENVVILRPAWLMHNYIPPFAEYHFPELKGERVLATAMREEVRMSHLDPRDIGEFAKEAFLNPGVWRGREVEMGWENFTTGEAAEIFGRVVGVEVRGRGRSGEEVERMKESLVTLPFQLLANEERLEIKGLEKYGVGSTRFEEFLEREKGSLRKFLGLEE